MHQQWVIDLATRLRQDGIDAVLDKWDLKPGHDAFAFMEQMVSDPSVTKVIIVCDGNYARKADQREGGVGTESQIISPSLYGKATQDKFCAVITELGDDGQPLVPVYYRGRIYFDFSSADRSENSYEGLLRWLLDKPEHIKPPLGQVPPHINDPQRRPPATSSRYRRAEEALRLSSPGALGYIRDYVDALAKELEGERITTGHKPDADEDVVKSIRRLGEHSSEIASLAKVSARYDHSDKSAGEIHRILETTGPFMFRPEHVNSWTDTDYDNFGFFNYFTILSACASFIEEGRMDLLARLLAGTYIFKTRSGKSRPYTFAAFCANVKSLNIRNDRLNLKRADPQADLVKEEAERLGKDFATIIQADILLFLRDSFRQRSDDDYDNWYPHTVIYLDTFSPLPVFLKAESARFFEQLKLVLGVKDSADLRARTEKLTSTGYLPRIGWRTLSITGLMNLDRVATVD